MQPKMQKYSKAEVARHSSKKSCWVVISGKVYDLTSFLMKHPGGYDILLHASGREDAAPLFEEVGHSKAALRKRKGFLIGVIDGADIQETDDKATADEPEAETQETDTQETDDKAMTDEPEAKKSVELKKHSYIAGIYDSMVPIFVSFLGFVALYVVTIYEQAKASA